jgi:hypothetical protein
VTPFFQPVAARSALRFVFHHKFGATPGVNRFLHEEVARVFHVIMRHVLALDFAAAIRRGR